jgi:hypothetical protein
MEHEHSSEHRRHELVVRIEPVDGLFEGSVMEADTGRVHFAMSGPPRPYGEVVDELLEALRRHLLSPGE